MTHHARIFEAERSGLIALCYRMLGERASAEDAVQDTWIKWAATEVAHITHPGAWLRRVATRIAMDMLRSARHRREIYVGPWLPEPLLMDETPDNDHPFERAQECELALLWAMERLNERERAAFILREAFDASYAEIAETLATSEAACRQLTSRAQKKLKNAGPKFHVPAEDVAALSQKFFMAITAEDFDTALAMMTPETLALSDGGRTKRAARRPLVGGAEILQVLTHLWREKQGDDRWSWQFTMANAAPAALQLCDGRLDSVVTLAPDDEGRISWIYIQRNPDKLRASGWPVHQ